MQKTELEKWLKENVIPLEKNYILHRDPRKQSGFSGSEYKWTKCRKPIADCIEREGTFLDAGCANGYLLQSMIKWKSRDGINVIPYGLDIGHKLIELSKKRLQQYACNFFQGNIINWEPPFKFDYVRTELVYVPEEYRKSFINRLLNKYVKSNGKLILCEYRSAKDDPKKPWIDSDIKKFGYKIAGIKSGFFKGKELSRVVSIYH